MSSISETHTRTPHSRELSDRTGPTDYSPEVLRFSKMSMSSDPFIESIPLSPEAPAFEPGGAVRTHVTDPQAFAAVVDMIRRGPQPDPPVNLFTRMHNGTQFAQTSEGEPSTCFVWVTGNHHISDYHGIHGRFNWIKKTKTFVSIQSRNNGHEVFIYFRDVRDAEYVVNELRKQGNTHLNPPMVELHASCISVEQYCYASRDSTHPLRPQDLGASFATGFDGQILVHAHLDAELDDNAAQGNAAWIQRHVMDFVTSFGDVKVVKAISDQEDTSRMTFHIEMFEPVQADSVVSFLSHFTLQGWKMTASAPLYFRGEYFGRQPIFTPESSVDSAVSFGSQEPKTPVREGGMQDSLTPFRRRFLGQEEDFHSQVSPGEYGSQHSSPSRVGIIGQNRPGSIERPLHTRGGNSFDFNSFGSASRRENKNTVDVTRIRAGQDVRTTIMLRNIPNRIDQPMLKQIIDDTSFGKYDFMYLRIDFTNNCNVGYAFINFQLPEDIIPFVMNIVGQRWANSDKVAEVSYATMQGRETLVQKFRNSSVMNEAPASRPKLFYTKDHPLCGQEEPFPGPDNLFKLARSNQNAAHIGLFSPGRGGASYTGLDRHRRGQFDRGTSFANAEELFAEIRFLRNMTGFQHGGRGGGRRPTAQAIGGYY